MLSAWCHALLVHLTTNQSLGSDPSHRSVTASTLASRVPWSSGFEGLGQGHGADVFAVGAS